MTLDEFNNDYWESKVKAFRYAKEVLERDRLSDDNKIRAAGAILAADVGKIPINVLTRILEEDAG